MSEKITRTVKCTDMDIVCINPETMETSIISFHLNGIIDKKEQLKKAKKLFERDDRILLKVENYNITEELREMDLNFFIENSIPVEQKNSITYK